MRELVLWILTLVIYRIWLETHSLLGKSNDLTIQGLTDVGTSLQGFRHKYTMELNYVSKYMLSDIILAPGAYFFKSSGELKGAITFDAKGDTDAEFFIVSKNGMKIKNNVEFILLNGASFENIYVVGISRMNIGSQCRLRGNFMSMGSIDVNQNTYVNGRLLSLAHVDVSNIVVVLDAASVDVSQLTPTPAAYPTRRHQWNWRRSTTGPTVDKSVAKFKWRQERDRRRFKFRDGCRGRSKHWMAKGYGMWMKKSERLPYFDPHFNFVKWLHRRGRYALRKLRVGSASSFAILGGSVTTTGITEVTGDIGTYPYASSSGVFEYLNATSLHAGDKYARLAMNDIRLTVRWAIRMRFRTFKALPSTLHSKTLTPGTYVTRDIVTLGGALTFDGQWDRRDATFIILISNELHFSGSASVNLINGAILCGLYLIMCR